MYVRERSSCMPARLPMRPKGARQISVERPFGGASGHNGPAPARELDLELGHVRGNADGVALVRERATG